MKQDYFLIGEITRPQGIRGEVKVRHYTDDPERFHELEWVHVKGENGWQDVRVLACRVFKDDVFLALENVPDRSAAEEWRGTELYVDRAHARVLAENEVYIADIIGLKAFDTKGRELGTLRDVMTGAGTPVLVFDTPRGTLMLPMLADVFSADVVNGRLTLDESRLDEVGLYEDRDSDAVPRDV